MTGRLMVSILGAILGMFYFGYNSGVINAPEQSIKTFITKSYKEQRPFQVSIKKTFASKFSKVCRYR